jgi:O-antigen ligase
MSIPVKLFERIYLVFVLSLAASAFVSIFVNTDSSKLTSPVTTIAWLFIYAVTVLRLLARRHLIRTAITGNRPLFFLIGLCFVSSLWSVDGNATRHAATALILTTGIALDFHLRYSFEEIVRFTAYTLIALILLGVPFDLYLHLVPSDDFDPTNWHGVFGTKNDLGRLVVMASVLFFCLPNKYPILKLLAIPALYLLLYEVKSTGALFNFSLMLAAVVASRQVWFKPRARTLALGLTVLLGGVGAYVAIAHRADVTTSVGKDPSLTGRTELWRMAIRSIEERPVLGYGYAAFWGRDQQLAWRIRENSNWPTAPHSHNGYLEIGLGLGLVGFATLLVVYAKMGRQAYRYLANNRSTLTMVPLIYLIFFIFYQFTEGTLVGGNSIFWIMFVLANLQLASEKRSTESANLAVIPRQQPRFGPSNPTEDAYPA